MSKATLRDMADAHTELKMKKRDIEGEIKRLEEGVAKELIEHGMFHCFSINWTAVLRSI